MIEVNGYLLQEDEQTILNELKGQLYGQGKDFFHKFVKTNNNIQTTCPFHKDGQERKPSFGILTKNMKNKKAGTCHCFACGWTGSFEEMVSNCFGYDDAGIFGNKWIAKNFQTISIESRPDINLGFERNTTPNKIYVPDDEYDKFRVYHPYMWKRKMTPELVELFDIGYDAGTQCITFPNKDENGNILFIARRSVNTKYFNYPESVDKPVYGLYELYKNFTKLDSCGNSYMRLPNDIIICESMINAITCWAYGKFAVALNGTGTPSQYRKLNNTPIRHYTLALDPDDAGLKGTDRFKNNLPNKLISEYIIPVGKDINDLSKDEFDNLKEIFN